MLQTSMKGIINCHTITPGYTTTLSLNQKTLATITVSFIVSQILQMDMTILEGNSSGQ